MRRSLFAVLALSTMAMIPAQAQTPEEAVLNVTKAMLEVLTSRDAAAARALVIPETRFTLTRPTPEGGTRVLVMTGEQFIEAVTRPGDQVVEELIRNPSVKIDGALATVWAEYQLVINGVVHHCGFDAFHLVNTAGGWKVLNVSDTYREQGCGAAWHQNH